MSENTATLEFSPEQITGVYKYDEYKKMISALSKPADDVAHVKAWEKQVAEDVKVDDGTSPILGFMKDAYDIITASTTYFLENGVNTTSFDTWLALRDMFCAATRLTTIPGYVNQAYEGITVRDMVITCAEMADIVFRCVDKKLLNSAPPVADDKVMQARLAPIYMDIVCGRSVFWIAYVDAIGNELATLRDTSWPEIIDKYANTRFVLCATEFMNRMQCNEDVAVTALSAALCASAYMYDDNQAKIFAHDCYGVKSIGENIKQAYTVKDAHVDFEGFDEPIYKMGNDESGYTRLAKVPPIAAIMAVPSMLEMKFRLAFMEMRMNA